MESVKTPLEAYAEKHFAVRYYSHTGNYGLGSSTWYYAELLDIQPKEPVLDEERYEMRYTGESTRNYQEALRKAWALVVDDLGQVDADEIEAMEADPA